MNAVCVVCHKADNGPSPAMTEFRGVPSFGSRFDFGTAGFLRLWVCDDCLAELQNVRFAVRKELEQAPLIAETDWWSTQPPEWHRDVIAKASGMVQALKVHQGEGDT